MYKKYKIKRKKKFHTITIGTSLFVVLVGISLSYSVWSDTLFVKGNVTTKKKTLITTTTRFSHTGWQTNAEKDVNFNNIDAVKIDNDSYATSTSSVSMNSYTGALVMFELADQIPQDDIIHSTRFEVQAKNDLGTAGYSWTIKRYNQGVFAYNILSGSNSTKIKDSEWTQVGVSQLLSVEDLRNGVGYNVRFQNNRITKRNLYIRYVYLEVNYSYYDYI